MECFRDYALRISASVGLLAIVGSTAPAKAAMEQTSLAQTPAIVAFLAAYIAEDANIWRDKIGRAHV